MTARPSPRTVAVGGLYIAASVGLAGLAAWPIYRTPALLVLIGVSVVVAAALVGAVVWSRGNGWHLAGLLALAVLLLGVPLAVPSRWGPPSEILRGLGELGAGLLFGAKDMLTVDLPLGDYRNLLVPALVVFLIGTALALWLVWRPDAGSAWAVPVVVAMGAFGLVFGRGQVSTPLRWGPLTFTAPVETAVSVGTLVLGVWWLGWRTRRLRRSALRRVARSSGIRARRAGTGRIAVIAAAGVLVAALGVSLAVPALAGDRARAVPRDALGPRIDLSREASPLSGYRALFSDERIDEVLFTVDAPTTADRVRLAVLDHYDGVVFRTGEAPFVRVPAARDPGPGAAVSATVTLGALPGPWMPVVGSPARTQHQGARAATLTDGFYVQPDLRAAVQTAAWEPGDSYRVDAVIEPARDLLGRVAPGGVRVATVASLREWIGRNTAATGGAALAELVTALRAQGYLSHGLTGTQLRWQERLGAYTFVPSASGHSLARMDELFQALLDAGTGIGGIPAGDDEQFAVATALIAGELGFPARVVLGARLTSTDPDLPVCEAGRCRAGDLSAWVEVRDTTGAWTAVDVTPQHVAPPAREQVARTEPRIGTEVRPDTVTEVVPAPPEQQGTNTPPPPVEDAAWLLTAVRAAALALGAAAVLVGPFALILAIKALRRRRRRRRGSPAERIAAGWDEYRDAARDAGLPAVAGATRSEQAARFATPRAPALAETADRAVFSGETMAAAESDRFWEIVDGETRAFAPRGVARWRAALSPRSLLKRPRSRERRSREAAPAPRRTPWTR